MRPSSSIFNSHQNPSFPALFEFISHEEKSGIDTRTLSFIVYLCFDSRITSIRGIELKLSISLMLIKNKA